MLHNQFYKRFKFLLLLLFAIIKWNEFILAQSELEHLHLASDTLFNSQQNINILMLNKNDMNQYQIDLVYQDSLVSTSTMGIRSKAYAAINGGFFNMKEGYSVSYLEHRDSIIAVTQNEKEKRKTNTSMLNASFIIEKEGDVIIQREEKDSVYYSSQKEHGVLGAGPLLLMDGRKSLVRATPFSSNRHPRTCICETEKSILFVTIDGRNTNAAGMTLFELQDFLISLDCLDAINMDGGGSTTMWIKEKGVVNMPSDNTGERPAANAIIIRKIED